MDFSLARFNHQVWKMRLRSFLDGYEQLDIAEAVSHRDCDLGKWLYAEGLNMYKHVSEIHMLEKTHAELHKVVKQVIQLKNAGEDAQAQDEFKRVSSISEEVISLLKSIEQQVK
jgi:methyl-accepting chemotaxis protein